MFISLEVPWVFDNLTPGPASCNRNAIKCGADKARDILPPIKYTSSLPVTHEIDFDLQISKEAQQAATDALVQSGVWKFPCQIDYSGYDSEPDTPQKLQQIEAVPLGRYGNIAPAKKQTRMR